MAAGLIASMALPVAEGASGFGMLKHYRLPTSTDPDDVTTATDGNAWFTVQGAFDPATFFTPGSVEPMRSGRSIPRSAPLGRRHSAQRGQR